MGLVFVRTVQAGNQQFRPDYQRFQRKEPHRQPSNQTRHNTATLTLTSYTKTRLSYPCAAATDSSLEA
jgi:hypothetical protein